MKLLHCPLCGDALGLLGREWRVCVCGASGGQYNADHVTATLGGAARVFGVANPFFNEIFPLLDAAHVRKVHDHFGYTDQDGEIWWGEFPGDVQIFRVEDPDGPRLDVDVERVDAKRNKVRVKPDGRPFTIDGKADLTEVVVPSNPRPARRQLVEPKPKEF